MKPLLRRARARLCLVVMAPLLPLALWACSSHPLSAPDPRPEVQSNATVAVGGVKLDLLFMVDNSLSMVQEQESLALNFPRFMEELQKAGELDLRVGVISSNVGAGGTGGPCQGLGDGGQFRVNPACGLQPGAGFLSLDRQGNKNFTGDLSAAFGCLAKLGTEGCGYEHQLQAVRFALYSDQAKQFLRPDAHLGIVIITDEDDCSGEPESTLYSEMRTGENPNLRCAVAGHVCGDQEVPAGPFTAPLASCKPFERAADPQSRLTRLINVSEFVDHIKAIKAGTRFQVLVSGIVGWDDTAGKPYTIERRPADLDLAPVCEGAGGAWAMPAVRLKAFVDAFGAQGSLHSICKGDLREAMERIGKKIVTDIGGRCVQAPLIDTDPGTAGLQPECVVSIRPGGAGPEQPLPRCAQAGATDCWDLTPEATCSSGQFFNVRPGKLEGTVSAGCATCAIPGDPRCVP